MHIYVDICVHGHELYAGTHKAAMNPSWFTCYLEKDKEGKKGKIGNRPKDLGHGDAVWSRVYIPANQKRPYVERRLVKCANMC